MSFRKGSILLLIGLPLLLRLCLCVASLDGAWSLATGALLPLFALCAVLITLYNRTSLGGPLTLALVSFNLAVVAEDLAVGTHEQPAGWPVLSWNLGADHLYPAQIDCAVDFLQQQPRGLWAFQEVSRSDMVALEARLDLQCLRTQYQEQGHGNGLALCVPRSPEWNIKSGYHHSMPGAVKRYLFAEVLTPGATLINVANVHLQSLWGSKRNSSPDRLEQLSRMSVRQRQQILTIMERFLRMKDPLVLMGDFNSTSNTWGHLHLRRQLQDAHRQRGFGMGMTRPIQWAGGHLGLRVDFLYSSPRLRWTGPTTVKSASDACSDHRAVQGWLSPDQSALQP